MIEKIDEIIQEAKFGQFEGVIILFPFSEFSLEYDELLQSVYKKKYRLKGENWTCKETGNKYKLITISRTKWKPLLIQNTSFVFWENQKNLIE